MKRLTQIGWVAAATAVSVLAVAQTAVVAKSAAEAKTAIDARQNLFKDIKKTYEPLGAMLKRQRELEPALIATNATQLQEMAGKIAASYAVDTRGFKDIKTSARDGIWTSQADFKAKADEFVKAAAAAAAAAKGEDKGAILKSVAGIGKTCGGCHDSYRDEV
ncbi:MAG: cytochrome c [Steroidobacteraceae bacterium]